MVWPVLSRGASMHSSSPTSGAGRLWRWSSARPDRDQRPNGAGKTSIVEGIVVATLGVSPRSAQMADLVRSGAPAVRVGGDFIDPTHPGRSTRREIGYATGIGRRMTLDDVACANCRCGADRAQCWCSSREELRAVKGPPAARRRSLDRLLEAVSLGFGEDLAAYQEALSQRNARPRRAGPRGRCQPHSLGSPHGRPCVPGVGRAPSNDRRDRASVRVLASTASVADGTGTCAGRRPRRPSPTPPTGRWRRHCARIWRIADPAISLPA